MEFDLRGEYRALVISRPELFENPRGAGFEILLDEDEIRQAEEYVAEQLRAFGAPGRVGGGRHSLQGSVRPYTPRCGSLF